MLLINGLICRRFLAAPIMWWMFFLRLLVLWSSFFWSSIADERRGRITAQHGIVATDHGECSKIGRHILRQGGHAVDAAVAAALCLGVVSPASSGIGGGAFMLLRSADGKTEAYDMRETAPMLSSQVILFM